jgi:hypothetical protein
MINGATKIIEGVPGKHLDPLLLAQSQSHDSTGFIMLAYDKRLETSLSQSSRFYDLLFFRGPEIFESARMNQDLRFRLDVETALQTFRLQALEDNTRIYLFTAPEQVISRFRLTLQYEPCLKIQVDALSKKQIARLLKAANCHRGIIEMNDFTKAIPLLDHQEVFTPEDIDRYQPKFKQGRLLLYDIERNEHLLHGRLNPSPSESDTLLNENTNNNVPTPPDSDQAIVQIVNSSSQLTSNHLDPVIDEKQADEFADFIRQILNSPEPASPNGEKDEKKSQPASVITSKEKPSKARHDHAVVAKKNPARPGKKIEPIKARTNHSDPSLDEHRAPQIEKPRSTSEPVPVADAMSAQSNSDFVRLFERLFRSFRQQAFDCLGDRCEATIAEAERRVRFLTPEFDLQSIHEDTAPAMLELIETITNEVSFLKRPRLRQAALTLVADLYNKQYELLERHRAIDKVEQFYYRLKK